MFKPTQCLQKTLRRLPLSPKQAGKEYYKGNRVGSMGAIDHHGNFHPDYSKIRTYVYPVAGIKNFELTPFVSRHVETNKEGRDTSRWSVQPKTMTGAEYLRHWKVSGGHDPVENVGNQPVPYEEGPGSRSKREG